MPQTGPWLRIFVALMLAVLPPILMLAGALLLARSILQGADPNLVAVMVVVAAIIWAAILAIVYTRILSEDVRSLVALAQRGEQEGESEASGAYRQLARSMDERNRQVASLAQQSSLVSIDDPPSTVVAGLVTTVRTVLEDPTWRIAVLASDNPELLPAGVYRAVGEDPPFDDIGELERWAAVASAEGPARLVEGPWGAFAVAELAISERLRAILYAPWEGRTAPTAAEVNLLRLVSQHAGTALDHSLLYARVRSQADELNRLASVQADFLRGVTHDLQTPLTSIGALATEVSANEALPKAARGDLDLINHQADRLRRMVGQLLVASRLEAGARLAPRQEVFAVGPIVERTWNALRANRPFAVTVDGPPHLAVGDPDRFEQVLWAVLDNAVKYSPHGAPIDVHIHPDGGNLCVTVRDQGMGMDQATVEHAFEQFYRSAGARRMAPDGSGVGLYAARGLMEAMRGTISVRSRLGGGTETVVGLPAEPSQAAD